MIEYIEEAKGHLFQDPSSDPIATHHKELYNEMKINPNYI